jgi:hypothetical protein
MRGGKERGIGGAFFVVVVVAHQPTHTQISQTGEKRFLEPMAPMKLFMMQ